MPHEYSKETIKRFMNPLHMGEIVDAQGVGQVGNAMCGDVMQIFLQIQDGRIIDAKLKTMGCAAAIASSDMAVELIIGLTIEEASKLSNKTIEEKLGGLPKAKLHCSVLGAKAIKAAVEDFQKKQK